MAPNGKQMESSLLGTEVVNMRSFMSLHNRLIHVDPENISHENIFSETLLEDFSISLLLNCSELTFKGHFCCSRMSVCCFQLHHFSRDTFGSDSCRSECETKGSNLSIHELCTICVNSFTISYPLIFKITQYPEYHHLDILLFSNTYVTSHHFYPVVFQPRLQMRNFPKAWMANSGEDIEAKLRSSHGQTLPPMHVKGCFLWGWFFWYFLLRGRDYVSVFFFMCSQSTVYLWNWTLYVWKDVMPKREAIVFHSHESSLRRQSHHVTSEVFCWNSHTTSGKAIHFDRKLLSTFGDITGIQVGYDGFYR